MLGLGDCLNLLQIAYICCVCNFASVYTEVCFNQLGRVLVLAKMCWDARPVDVSAV